MSTYVFAPARDQARRLAQIAPHLGHVYVNLGRVHLHVVLGEEDLAAATKVNVQLRRYGSLHLPEIEQTLVDVFGFDDGCNNVIAKLRLVLVM